jgi:hypothetical protein
MRSAVLESHYLSHLQSVTFQREGVLVKKRRPQIRALMASVPSTVTEHSTKCLKYIAINDPEFP